MIFAPPVVPVRLELSDVVVPVPVPVSSSGLALQGQRVIYIYTTIRAYTLFLSSATQSISGVNMIIMPTNRVLRFVVSPTHSYLYADRVGLGSGFMYWYLAGDNGD